MKNEYTESYCQFRMSRIHEPEVNDRRNAMVSSEVL